MARGGKNKKKNKSKAKKNLPVNEEDETNKVSKSFVFANGKVARSVKLLIKDWRLVMMPFTAKSLKEREKNSIKDFASVAGQLGVTHFNTFTTSGNSSYLRIVRVPRGPTLTFKLHSFSLIRDVIQLQQNPHSPGVEYNTAPLVVLNNFNSEEQHIKLMSVMFQNLFPAINIATIKVIDCRRVVLFDYDKETKQVTIRHFLINVKPVGISKSVKQLAIAKSNKIPSLANFEDISEYVLRGANASESDVEDAEDGKVVLPENHAGRLNLKQKQTAVRLTEIGPRMSIQLVKIEDDFFSGDVIFHEYVQKTPEEAEALRKYHAEKKKEKERRRKEQEANVKRKRGENVVDSDVEDTGANADEMSDDDDAEYYRQEVGEEPDQDLFGKKEEKRVKFNPLYKKKRKEGNDNEQDVKPKKRKQNFSKGGGAPKKSKKFEPSKKTRK